MPKRAAALVLTLILNVPVEAQQGVAIEIFQYGLYTLDVVGRRPMPDGLTWDTVENICHVRTTGTVPAQLGLHFGFRYRIAGEPEGEVVDLRTVTIFPKPGVRPPGSAQPIESSEHLFSARLGTTSFRGYGFDYGWELAPGRWSMQIWHGKRLLAEQDFAVVPSNGEPVPLHGGSTDCFRVSML